MMENKRKKTLKIRMQEKRRELLFGKERSSAAGAMQTRDFGNEGKRRQQKDLRKISRPKEKA